MFAKRTILQALAQSKMRLYSVSMIVMLSMGSHALAAVLCPHVGGSEEACVTDEIKGHAEAKPPDVAAPAGNDSPEASHCHRTETTKPAADSQAEFVAESSAGTVAEAPINNGSTENLRPSEAVTQTDDDCAHCMMHSQKDPAGWSLVVVQSRGAHETGPAGSTDVAAKASQATVSFLDIHDHSPPGASNARYLLLNIFRI